MSSRAKAAVATCLMMAALSKFLPDNLASTILCAAALIVYGLAPHRKHPSENRKDLSEGGEA